MNGIGPTIVRHSVPPQLHGLVAGIIGFDEVAPPDGVVRHQPAGSVLVLEISFTTPLKICPFGQSAGTATVCGAFVAGLMSGPVRTVFFGRHISVQVYLTPLGAYRLLGIPGHETAGQVAPLVELAPRWAAHLPDRLAEAASWRERFAILDDVLLRLSADERPTDELVQWAWAALLRTGGQVRIAELASRSGWSARHLGTRFLAVTGVTPKQAAQVVRFERIHADLERWSLSEVAARHGLADQSHLCREVRRYAGESPAALARANRPTAFTAMGARPGQERVPL